MKVSFTTKEYARLLELAHLGLAVAGAQPEDAATVPERYAALAQKLFALAPEFGCSHLVETDLEGLFHPSSALLDGPARKKIETFTEDVFWSELASRLAERDLYSDLGVSADRSAPLSPDQEERLSNLEEGYWDELEKHGIDRLFLLKGGKG